MEIDIKKESSESECDDGPSENMEKTNSLEMLPKKSKDKYISVYKKFMEWKKNKKVGKLSENVLLAYFHELATDLKPSSLWASYSMLKNTINTHDSVNIGDYRKLIEFLKGKSVGFSSKKSQVLTPAQIKKFLDEAPDNEHLAMKVALIFGVAGGCKRDELTYLTIDNVQDKDSLLVVKIVDSKNNKKRRSFVVEDELYHICKKYMDARPKDVHTQRFFLSYRNGKCTQQVIGINNFGAMPKTIAKFLKLPNSDSYTGHSFRLSSASLRADAGQDLSMLMRYEEEKANRIRNKDTVDSLNNQKEICRQVVNSIADETSCSSSNDSIYNVKVEPSTSNNYIFENEDNMDPLNVNEDDVLSTKKCTFIFNNCSNVTIVFSDKKDIDSINKKDN